MRPATETENLQENLKMRTKPFLNLTGAGRPFLRRTGPALLCCAAWLALSGCLVKSDSLGDFGEQVSVNRLTGIAGAEAPGAPLFKTLTVGDYRGALRRIIVTYSTWTSFIQTEPTRLFSDSQIGLFGRILAKQMPGLRPDQTIEFRFKDAQEKFDVVVEIYKEGEFLVFRFSSLARDPSKPAQRYVEASDKARIAPQAGQRVDSRADTVLLWEPMRSEVVIRARSQQQKLNLIALVLKAGDISETTAVTLRKIAETSPSIALATFRDHFRKRKTLGKARDQDLITLAEFQTRMARLVAELGKMEAENTSAGEKPSVAGQAGKRVILRALRDGIIAEEEAARIEALLQSNPTLSVGRLRLFFEKRQTLGEAKEQQLLTAEEFRTKLEHLTKALSK